MSRLDEFTPVWQFHEVHSITVRAMPDRAYRAVRAVTASEIPRFRALTWLRRLGRRGPPSILNPPAHLPVLDVATRTGFLLLADEPNRELVVGTVVITPRSARRLARSVQKAPFQTTRSFQRPRRNSTVETSARVE